MVIVMFDVFMTVIVAVSMMMIMMVGGRYIASALRTADQQAQTSLALLELICRTRHGTFPPTAVLRHDT